MDYFEKIEEKPGDDMFWNVPEKKQGTVNVVGGNTQSFRTEIKVSEFLASQYPIENLNVVLPDVLKNQLPTLPNFRFLKSTDSGSFMDEKELLEVINSADYNLVLGDMSKNTVTGKALASACHFAEKPLILTRDAVDLLINNQPEKNLMNENIVYFASMAQLQKLLRAVYYPKMLLLSQSLVQAADVLHKFTLSYPISIITLHNEQVLVAKNGAVKAVSLEKTGYSPIMFWHGELAAKILALNLYNPERFMDATISAIFSK
jgi:hypothetical protein